MKKSLLALASLVVAGVAMAADGGTLTFNSYYSASNNMKVVADDGQEISTANNWYLTLLSETGAQVMGTKGSTLGALAPVVVNFTGTSGFAAAGGDWSLAGFDQGATVKFYVAAFKGTTYDYASAQFKGNLGPFGATLGGGQLVPPGPAGKLAFGGTPVLTVVIPEPSVLALGLLGMGAFLIRRRS